MEHDLCQRERSTKHHVIDLTHPGADWLIPQLSIEMKQLHLPRKTRRGIESCIRPAGPPFGQEQVMELVRRYNVADRADGLYGAGQAACQRNRRPHPSPAACESYDRHAGRVWNAEERNCRSIRQVEVLTEWDEHRGRISRAPADFPPVTRFARESNMIYRMQSLQAVIERVRSDSDQRSVCLFVAAAGRGPALGALMPLLMALSASVGTTSAASSGLHHIGNHVRSRRNGSGRNT